MALYEQRLFQMLDNLKRQIEIRPLNLGAIASVSGGTPGRPGGFIGYLPQTRVAYDTAEISSNLSPGSPTLLDNLNHIRYRLTAVESGGSPGTFTIKENGIVVASGISILDFSGSVAVTESPAGEANVVITASGSGATTLNELTDVTITTPASGEVLTYNGSNWINTVPSGTSHAPVTVLDTTTLDLTITGQQLQGRVIFSGVNHNQLLNTHNLTTDIDHLTISNIGSNTHSQIDTHIADTTIHFDELGELGNVNVATVVSGEVLKYNGTQWVNALVSGTGSSGHTILYSGVSVTQRSSLNFTGGVTVLDDSANLETDIHIHKHIFNEDLTLQILASGTTQFTTVHYIQQNTLQMYYNGLRQRPTYYTTFSGNHIQTTFGLDPSDELVVDYLLNTSYIPPASGISIGLLTEGGDYLITEGGDYIIQE